MESEILNKKEAILHASIHLPASKSESNRVLIIDALGEAPSRLDNLSEARDTQIMMDLLNRDPEEYNVQDAGTTMRFLTAFASVTQRKKKLCGTPRMHQRPIGLLVNALSELGGKFEYLGVDGYPPHRTLGFDKQLTNQLTIRGDVSSQYISALLMIAPSLPEGLELNLTGKVGSRPYISMTLGLMRRFGIESKWEGSSIKIVPQTYKSSSYTVESDWSGASYWYSLVALSPKGSKLYLGGLRKESLQGDSTIQNIMTHLGVQTTFDEKGLWIEKISSPTQTSLTLDFSDCPDLAQTVLLTCSVLGVSLEMTGLESLKIKETDRIAAMQNELWKIGAVLKEANNIWKLHVDQVRIPAEVEIETYEDHRMAMAFAPLSTKCKVIIKDPSVVNKSYPSFWRVWHGN